MGYMCHHAIIVTNYDKKNAEEAHQKAKSFGLQTSEVVESTTDSYFTFVVFPDGSKEGWPESEEGDAKRGLFIKWIKSQVFEDGSTSFDWAHLQYGDEEGDDKILEPPALPLTEKEQQ